jgi:8-oxo-dGTP diphosphatase
MTAGNRTIVVIACVLVDIDGRVLLAERPQGRSLAGLWEFPGGKMEEGETPEETLIRELREELSIEVKPACLAPLTFASHGYEDFHLLMPLFICRKWGGEVHPREGQKIAWVPVHKMREYEMPPADLPLLSMIYDLL